MFGVFRMFWNVLPKLVSCFRLFTMGCCKSRKRRDDAESEVNANDHRCDDSDTEDLAYPWASERFGEPCAPGPLQRVPRAPVYDGEGYCLTLEGRNRRPITRDSDDFYEFTARDM